jgi:hypothetical protein
LSNGTWKAWGMVLMLKRNAEARSARRKTLSFILES